MIQISEQDEHIRALLDRKGKIEHLKMETIEKVKQFAYTRTLTAVVQQGPQVIETRSYNNRTGGMNHTVTHTGGHMDGRMMHSHHHHSPMQQQVITQHAPMQRTTTTSQVRHY